MQKESTSIYNHLKAIKKKSIKSSKPILDKKTENKEDEKKNNFISMKKREISVKKENNKNLDKKIQVTKKIEFKKKDLKKKKFSSSTGKDPIFGISEKTRKLIENIKRKNDKKKVLKSSNQERIDNLREKLYNKIKEKKIDSKNLKIKKNFNIERNLPYRYKEYMDLMEEFDYILNLFKIREDVCFFSEIKQVLKNTYHKNFGLEDIRKIIFLVPELYELKWVFSDKSKKNELVINLKIENNKKNFFYLKRKEAKERLEIFRYRCMGYLNENCKVIENKKNVGKLTNYFEKKNDKKKDFSEIEIPMIELPQKKNQIKAKKISEIISFMDKKKIQEENLAIIGSPKKESILEKLKKKRIIQSPKKTANLTNKEKVELLKQKIYNKMRRKHLKAEIVKNKVQTKNNMKDILINISKILHFHYKIRKVENMFYTLVIEYISKNSNCCLSYGESEFYLKILLDNYPQWLFLVENDQGTILRMNKHMKIDRIICLIKNK